MDTQLLQEGLQYAEENYKKLHSHSYLDKVLIKERFDLKNKAVLDFGCGMGNMSLWFANTMKAKVDGVDIDENHITVAKELNNKYQVPNVEFYLKNILLNPINKLYDFIFLNDVIEHIKLEWIQGILDILILKNLKNKGVIFFSYPPWEGPHASHLQRAIKIPWIQFLPHKFVMRQIEKHNQKLVGKGYLMEEYLELNHMTHNKLMGYLKKYDLKLILRKSHTKLNTIKALKNVNFNSFPFKYIVTKELIAFQKQ